MSRVPIEIKTTITNTISIGSYQEADMLTMWVSNEHHTPAVITSWSWTELTNIAVVQGENLHNNNIIF